MSMLSRFRKPGGFQQLLTLMETCDDQKKKNLMLLLSSEDPGWAHLVKIKSLTFERVLSWPVNVLMEITPHLSDRVLVTAYQIAEAHPLLKGSHEKWLKALPSLKAREITNLSEMTPFSASEHLAAKIKIIQTVRELEAKGHIRFANFDPSLEVDTRIAA